MENFQERIDKLKEPRLEMVFGTLEMQNTDHAVEILLGLKNELADSGKSVGLEKVKSAIRYLEEVQKKLLENPEINTKGEINLEELRKNLDLFMAETFLIWYGKKNAGEAKISMEMADLSRVDYEALSNPDPTLFGQYTMNSETARMNHNEKESRVKILNEELKKFIGKPKSEVVAYVVKTYGGQYHIPGIEYEKYLLENPDKVPEQLKDGNWYYFMGSLLRGRGGDSFIPCVSWDDSELDRDAYWLDDEWDEDDRVLLLEK